MSMLSSDYLEARQNSKFIAFWNLQILDADYINLNNSDTYLVEISYS